MSGKVSSEGCLSTSILEKVVSSENDAVNILLETTNQNEQPGIIPEHYAEQKSSVSGFVKYKVSPLSKIEPADLESLRIWNACRFVRMGWLNAHEAMTLVDLYVWIILGSEMIC